MSDPDMVRVSKGQLRMVIAQSVTYCGKNMIITIAIGILALVYVLGETLQPTGVIDPITALLIAVGTFVKAYVVDYEYLRDQRWRVRSIDNPEDDPPGDEMPDTRATKVPYLRLVIEKKQRE